MKLVTALEKLNPLESLLRPKDPYKKIFSLLSNPKRHKDIDGERQRLSVQPSRGPDPL